MKRMAQRMAKPKTAPKQYAAAVARARKAGGDEQQSHLLDRLTAEMKRRAKSAKKRTTLRVTGRRRMPACRPGNAISGLLELRHG